ncbi:AP-1-like transcription factor YAP1 [Pseudocercospora fuligena]|uniref:AP-1-like transcription factor YAP1 n=1 Tax=Pseudocercospora fuligena TaxID=685502 RepID=A0A8H6RHH1_9PEZI|nr:AP-1-like transcription factor YAP1 [Pseudocercospora fuligena]
MASPQTANNDIAGSIEPGQHPGAEWAHHAGHHVSASQHGLAAAHSRINSSGAVQKVPIHREPARRDSRRSSGSPGAQKEKEGSMTVLASGPMSSAVTIQARPKPGRKPIPHEDAQDRRRVQNRVAQRNFRDKRQQKLQDAVDELAARKSEYESKVSENQRQIDALTQQNNHLQSQLRAQMDRTQAEISRANAAEERVRALESQVASYQERTRTSIQAGSAAISGPGSIGGFRAISSTQIPKALTETPREADGGPSPPASEEDQPYEIDFTNYGRTTQAPSNYGLRVTTSNDSNEMDFSFDRSDDKCGFCTDDQNCACKQEKVVERVIEAPIVVRSVTLPGSCDMCRADPVRAQACRDMARSTNMSAQTPVTTPTSETPRTSIFDSRTGLTAMMPPPRMSCSSMVDAFNKFGERTSSIASLFGGKALTAYPAATGGYEFEETQAAEVLSTLSRRSTMAESPQPDDSRRPSLVSTKTS